MRTKRKKLKIGHSLNPNRNVPKNVSGKGFGKFRSSSTIKRLKMYNNKPVRNNKGEIVRNYIVPKKQQHRVGQPARVGPNVHWFENTRVIGQRELRNYREELQKKIHDPYTVLLKTGNIPYSLLRDPGNNTKIKREIDFKNVFRGKKKQTIRKPKVTYGDLNELIEDVDISSSKYDENSEKDLSRERDESWDCFQEKENDKVFRKGSSKRIWNELFKVIDSSDVVVQVLDARNPLGTRTPYLEEYLKKEKPFKHLVFVLNKCDLVPTWVTVRWVKVLSREYPTIAFHSSIDHPFGKGALIHLLRQFSKLHSEKKSISVGFVGYPNVGKSSVINTLKRKKVCNVAPIPGETKVWQYVSLMSKISLIDCPGVVVRNSDKSEDLVFKSVIRPEKIVDAEFYVKTIIDRVKSVYLVERYKVPQWTDHFDFLRKLARRMGKLHKDNKEDLETTAKILISDWQRGKLPWFVCPPFEDDLEAQRLEKIEEIKKGEDKIEIRPQNERSNDVRIKKFDVNDNEDENEGEIDEEEEVVRKKKKKSKIHMQIQDFSALKMNPGMKFSKEDKVDIFEKKK